MNLPNNTNVPIGLDEAVLKQLTDNLSEQQLITASAAYIAIWTAFKRAGAAVIITYAARFAKKWLEEY